MLIVKRTGASHIGRKGAHKPAHGIAPFVRRSPEPRTRRALAGTRRRPPALAAPLRTGRPAARGAPNKRSADGSGWQRVCRGPEAKRGCKHEYVRNAYCGRREHTLCSGAMQFPSRTMHSHMFDRQGSTNLLARRILQNGVLLLEASPEQTADCKHRAAPPSLLATPMRPKHATKPNASRATNSALPRPVPGESILPARQQGRGNTPAGPCCNTRPPTSSCAWPGCDGDSATSTWARLSREDIRLLYLNEHCRASRANASSQRRSALWDKRERIIRPERRELHVLHTFSMCGALADFGLRPQGPPPPGH